MAAFIRPTDSAQQIMFIQNRKRNLRMPGQTAPHGRGDRRARLAAQAGLLQQLNLEAAHGAHFAACWGDAQHHAQVPEQILLQLFQLFIRGDGVDMRQQALFFRQVQAQDGQAGLGLALGQQPFARAVAQLGRALLADFEIGHALGYLCGQDGRSSIGRRPPAVNRRRDCAPA